MRGHRRCKGFCRCCRVSEHSLCYLLLLHSLLVGETASRVSLYDLETRDVTTGVIKPLSTASTSTYVDPASLIDR